MLQLKVWKKYCQLSDNLRRKYELYPFYLLVLKQFLVTWRLKLMCMHQREHTPELRVKRGEKWRREHYYLNMSLVLINWIFLIYIVKDLHSHAIGRPPVVFHYPLLDFLGISVVSALPMSLHVDRQGQVRYGFMHKAGHPLRVWRQLPYTL